MIKKKEIVVALAGNPNSGKTSLFNELVGTNQKVGNWAGVTIEKYEGTVIHKGYSIRFIDLPGTYSLTAYSPEEVITRNFIIEKKPDVVVNVVDGTSLERNLYLTVQLMELKTNLILALNMFDEVEKAGIKIDIKQLQNLLGSHIVPTSAVKKTGLKSLLDHIVRVYEHDIIIAKNKVVFSEQIEGKIDALEKLLEQEPQLSGKYPVRWLAIKLLENDTQVYNLIKDYPIWIKALKILHGSSSEQDSPEEPDLETAITDDRNSFIRGALRETMVISARKKKSVTERIDSVLINRVLGIPIFLLIMWCVFSFTFKLGEAPMGWIEFFFKWLANSVSAVLPQGFLRSIIVDGIIAGVGGVLVFLPNIILLFIALSFLEGTGYMARAAFVIDKVMHKVGLHGKSFLPMITGFGCSIPALMATRTLKNRGDRLVTMMIIPFMSCGAKLPVYVLLISAFFPPAMAGNVLFAIYIFGVLIAIISARLLKSTILKGCSEPFVMELPVYRLPTIKSILIQSLLKAQMYIKKAGTTILLASLIIWLASNYPQSAKISVETGTSEQQVNNSITLSSGQKAVAIQKLENNKASRQLEYSASGKAGKLIEPLIKPLGFDWRIGVALISGLAAKEVVVSTLGTIYSLGEADEKSVNLATRLRHDPGFSKAAALSLMVFVLLYIPCIATIMVFKKESGAWKWVGIYSVYALSVAWISSFIVYRIALLLGLGN
ncbi:MAG: ferrous iron transport protein B [Candidatus Margulisbacteria bacterium]|nr:ferrous iron transport protein B [Candidatus Margulisiibacteriota bacterium]